MSSGAWMMVVATAIALAALALVVVSLVRSITNERTAGRSAWQDFGLGLSLMILFLATWIAQGIAQWQSYTDEQLAHGEATQAGDFFAEFAHSTLENWQSEFLQLFAFVALTALYIHKGSAESKDSDEKMEASLRRIEASLGTLPEDAPRERSESWKLPDTPLKVQ
jgi:hypothetical protein